MPKHTIKAGLLSSSWKRETSDPPSFPFTLQLIGSGDRQIICHTTSRWLPGKRLSCLGRWGDRNVFVKLFIDAKRAEVHARREERGVRALAERGIPTPRLLHSGVAEGCRVLVFERIEPATPMRLAWDDARDAEERRNILCALLAVLASHHESGLVQEDLHLNNFLAAGERVFTLDGAGVEVYTAPLNKASTFDNLGLLFAQLHPQYDALARELYPAYAALRGWPVNEADFSALQARISARRERRKRDYLGKIFRECSAFVRIDAADSVCICDRGYYSAAMQRLLAAPNRAFHEGAEFLKRGNTSTLVKVHIDGRSLVIKRYNTKGFWHGLKRALKPTRAAKSWKNAHLLKFYGVKTALPVALVERNFGPIKRVSYFICEQVEGPDCRRYFADETLSGDERCAAAMRVVGLLDCLSRLNISHGDLKSTNIIMSPGGPAIVDLDAMGEHKAASRFAKPQDRDFERFLRNWDQDLQTRRLFEELLAVERRTQETHPASPACQSRLAGKG
jgi:tRNA A-37 threonylcarbamoyl transferase component Bud32